MGKVGEQQITTELHSAIYNYVTATGKDGSYIVSLSGVTSYREGMELKVKIILGSATPATLKFSGLTAKPVVNAKGIPVKFDSGGIYSLIDGGASFILLGEGGEYGTATAQDVLAPKTIGTENGLVTGLITNRGAIPTLVISNQNSEVFIPVGYHNGQGKVKATFDNLTASNIRSGTNVGGVTGTLEPKQVFAWTTPTVNLQHGESYTHRRALYNNIAVPSNAIFIATPYHDISHGCAFYDHGMTSYVSNSRYIVRIGWDSSTKEIWVSVQNNSGSLTNGIWLSVNGLY